MINGEDSKRAALINTTIKSVDAANGRPGAKRRAPNPTLSVEFGDKIISFGELPEWPNGAAC